MPIVSVKQNNTNDWIALTMHTVRVGQFHPLNTKLHVPQSETLLLYPVSLCDSLWIILPRINLVWPHRRANQFGFVTLFGFVQL